MRTDASELAAWWERYDRHKDRFVRGFVTRIEAIDALIQLRYRDDALKAEIKEWEKARKAEQDRRYFFKKQGDAMRRREKELENDARTVAASSSE